MWRNWNLNLPINQVPSSDEETYEAPEENELDNLVSPNRPHQSPSASPRALLRPDPPLVDEVLSNVEQRLRGLPSREQRVERRNEVRARQEAEVAAAAAAVAAGEVNNMAGDEPVNFEDENGNDDPRAMQDACRNLQNFEFEENDLLFYFQQIEAKMSAVGVKKNFTKFQVLSTIIPRRVIDQVKSLLRKQASDFPNHDAYKQLKREILRIFGPKPEAAVERALNRTLTGKPSELARALVNDICQHELDCRCCPPVIMALWKRHLPSSVRSGIAKERLTKQTFEELIEHADDIFEASRPPTVAAVTAQPLDETQPAIPYAQQEVAAIGRGGRGGRGRGGRGANRGGRGSGRGGRQAPANNQDGTRVYRGPKHPDLPAGNWTGCQMHHRWGKGAHFCTEPQTCPWKDVIATKPNK